MEKFDSSHSRPNTSSKVLHSDTSDSDSSCNSNDSSHDLNWKRSKASKTSDKFRGFDSDSANENNAFGAASQSFQSLLVQKQSSKLHNKFNVWSNVLQEQGLVEDLHSVGVDDRSLNNARDCEAYDYTLKYRLESGKQPGDQPIHQRLGLKRDNKDRQSQSLPLLDKSRRNFDVSDDQLEEQVVEGIAAILREPKKDLLGRVVNVLGKQKSIQMLRQTEDIEEAGGLMTLDNSRRRTPGGTFLHLIRMDHHISKTEKDKIFEVERMEYEIRKKKIKKLKRKTKALATVSTKEMEVTEAALPNLPSLGEILIKNSIMDIECSKKLDDNGSDKEPGELDDSDDDCSD